jgi:tRNA threonylcarbamoyladenosine biosynthesis protein TsaE
VDISKDISEWQKGIVTHTASETENAGETLAAFIPADTALLLEGKLGAGKTTFTRGFARGLGIKGDITSPSFSLLTIYEGRRQLLHVDAYRLTQPSQWDSLLIDELYQSPWNLLIEWPENVRGKEPKGAWTLKIENADNEARRLTLKKS